MCGVVRGLPPAPLPHSIPRRTMAYIRATKTGKFRVEVERAGVRVSDTFDTKAKARQWALQMEAELLAGKRGEFPRKTLREAFERYKTDVSPKKRGARPEPLRLDAFAREFPDIADKLLTAVNSSDMARWRDARLKVVSGGTVLRDINLLRNVFTVARDEWLWCGHNPFKGLKIPQDNPARDRRVMPSEVYRICRALGYVTGSVETKSQEVALAFLVALRTAMRAGEILSLTDDMLDLPHSIARLPMTKNGRPRVVPLSRRAVRLLSAVSGRGALFTVSSATMDVLFRRATKALGIKGLRFHDSRGEALTRMSKRVDVLTLARISGHRDIRILSEHYYRVTPEEIASRL